MADLARLSINQATTQAQYGLAEAIAAYSNADVAGISIWRDKLAECGLDKAVRMLADRGLRVSGLCRGGMFPGADAAARQANIDDNLLAIDEAVALGAACVVLVCGGIPEGSKDLAGTREMIRDGLGAILPHARAAGVPLAIEPLHPMYAADRCSINTLGQALDLCDQLDRYPGTDLGVAVDVYHLWWDPDLQAQIERAGERVLAFHVCDWLVPTTDLLLDRGMMGDGVINIRQIRDWVDATGYDGLIEVEIFSAQNWWKRPGDEVINTCRKRFLETV
ncbi:MAG: sugar phosphate isomerase/epimerase family protein [Alphaproteobacteria bacterium]|jgi:sugar phosphate isomerase/epimerase|nr:sugar phosphate isomerase/epimerase family protein [Alphaproteobacteria bacterium]MDP6253896.1 sugar phosphate isomerase/epimerase family protein [Alphaproteobacteria bacterium]MDP7056465.1 sugar phosphate isomerase/epimerase family protein [Alphaproteobacteria bacterium]MDP7230428.1 sugar phosphate isomerase/epimerase family protein [Alphaproteobacteria bacterium]MDP7459006.1 sugar phosphate isomerase/epimerase family protein [Alphaproteobacteria bacterium]|tara:strand:+ start:2804 stop:3637 length:834 start_codon:yes stop_codon:yes gene_type:complete